MKNLVLGFAVALAASLLISSQGMSPTKASVSTPVAWIYLPIVMVAEPTPTAIDTPTATPTPSPTPTVTPTPALTRVIVPAESWNPASITIVPGADWAVTYVKLLDPCENHNMGIGFVTTLDQLGSPLDNVVVKFRNGPYVFEVVSGDKGPGKAEVVMLGEGNYSMWVDRDAQGPKTSDVAANMETYLTAWNLPDYYRICAETGLEGNAPKHLGYAITFRRVQ